MGAQVSNGNGPKRRGRQMAEINVTPLVDVMLVLLIISMVAAPMLQRGIHLDLPATETASEIVEARVVVSLDREGRIRVNEKPVHEELFEERMRALAAARPGETVFLQADRLQYYGEVLRLMDTLRKAGITRISLVTVPLEVQEASRR
jgi:biopolymer transport protein TolR